MINTTRILSLMRLLKVQVQSQDCPWLWQGKGLGFGKKIKVLSSFTFALKISSFFFFPPGSHPRLGSGVEGCGGFKHEPAWTSMWWMYLKPKPHQHHNLARKQRKPEIFDWRHFCCPKVKRNFWQGLFLMQLWHQLLDSLQSNWLVCWTGWLWQATLADAHVSTRSQPWCKHAGSW